MNRLFYAVSGIDDALIEEADTPPVKRRRVYWIPVAVSATVAAAVAGLFMMNARRTPKLPLTPAAPTAAHSTEAPLPAETTAPSTEPAPHETTASPMAETIAQTTVPTIVATTASTEAPSGISVPVSTTVPTVLSTTAPSIAPSTVPTAAPTTVPTTVPSTAPTTVPSTVPSTAPTTVPTTVPTTAPTTVPTTEPAPHETTAAPVTEDSTIMHPEGGLAVLFVDGVAFYTSEDADLSEFNVTERLGMVQPAPLSVSPGETEAPQLRALSPEPELVGADVYRLIPTKGDRAALSERPTQYYLLEIDGQSIICASSASFV